jgi:hypothetical protein
LASELCEPLPADASDQRVERRRYQFFVRPLCTDVYFGTNAAKLL